jgi:hemerythrin superfamily protein
MVFMNSKYWTEERPIYPLLKKMNDEGKYNNLLLSISDESEEIMDAIRDYAARYNV